MYQETIDLISTRRSTRAFRKEAIPEETVQKLKELCMRAPTAGNMLLYSVVEVCSPEKKRILSEICDNQKMIEHAP
ncbi:MAG: nitroreductase family protein, partial [Spirochaetales bacterium]|nr:nitroreductase family protein [Candidatus Physcosoma equi]